MRAVRRSLGVSFLLSAGGLFLCAAAEEEKLSWVLGPYSNTNYIFRPARAVLAALPTLPITVRGQVPFFDCHVDSGGREGMPVPWAF